MSDFRDLKAWQKSMSLARDVYTLGNNLPSDEKFGLTSQIRRSAVSIPSNIAEGSKRRTKQDFMQFLKIASGSAAELETQLLLANDIYQTPTGNILEALKGVQRMLEALMKKL